MTYRGVHVAEEKVEKETLALAKGARHGHDDHVPVLDLILQQHLRQLVLVQREHVLLRRLDDLQRLCHLHTVGVVLQFRKLLVLYLLAS